MAVQGRRQDHERHRARERQLFQSAPQIPAHARRKNPFAFEHDSAQETLSCLFARRFRGTGRGSSVVDAIAAPVVA